MPNYLNKRIEKLEADHFRLLQCYAELEQYLIDQADFEAMNDPAEKLVEVAKMRHALETGTRLTTEETIETYFKDYL